MERHYTLTDRKKIDSTLFLSKSKWLFCENWQDGPTIHMEMQETPKSQTLLKKNVKEYTFHNFKTIQSYSTKTVLYWHIVKKCVLMK